MIRFQRVFILLFAVGAVSALAMQIDFGRFSKRSGCPFCTAAILDGQTFYRGSKSLAILTHKPAVDGHVLIIPARHVERFEELTSEEVADLGETIKKVDAAVRRAFATKDYALIQKNGREAGQSVPHVHFHYLPGSRCLSVKFLLSSWFKPMEPEKLMRLREMLSLAFSASDATDASPLVNFSSKPESE